MLRIDQESVPLRAGQARLLDLLRARIDRDADAVVEPFVRRILALPEREMRSAVLAERLLRLDVHLCLALLEGLLHRSLAREPLAQEVLLDLTTARPLMERLGYHRARRLYELARRRERFALARMLLSPETQLRRNDEPVPDYENKHMQDTSLGWRKALARGADREALDRLVFDRNPTVVHNLLNNPRIVERDVVRIAAMRPANPDCLAVVFAHERWLRRYRVRVALTLNPDTPLDIALTLLPQLMQPELRYAASVEKLDPTLRAAAREMLERRRARAVAARERRRSPVSEDEELDLAAIAAELEGWMAP